MINFTGIKADKAIKTIKPIEMPGGDKMSKMLKALDVKISAPLMEDVFEKTTKPVIFSEKTFDEAKSFVMQSILASLPKESAAYIENDGIIFKALGDAGSVNIDDALDKILFSSRKSIACIHSHPMKQCGVTLPVSFNDFTVLNSRPALRSVYAINADGEFSVLKKVGNKRPNILKIMNLEGDYWMELREYLKNMDNPSAKRYLKIQAMLDDFKGTKAEKEALRDEANALLDKMTDEESIMADFVHNFWQKRADSLHLQYETNFSGLC